MSAILGTEEVMQSAQKTFISSTNWTDRIGPAAALATINKYKKNKVEDHLIEIGNLTKSAWEECAKKNKINLKISGLPSLANFSFEYDNSNELNTFFTIEMLKEGYLGFRQFKPSFAHNKKIILNYKKIVDKIFSKINSYKDKDFLNTPIHHSGFQRLTKE